MAQLWEEPGAFSRTVQIVSPWSNFFCSTQLLYATCPSNIYIYCLLYFYSSVSRCIKICLFVDWRYMFRTLLLCLFIFCCCMRNGSFCNFPSTANCLWIFLFYTIVFSVPSVFNILPCVLFVSIYSQIIGYMFIYV